MFLSTSLVLVVALLSEKTTFGVEAFSLPPLGLVSTPSVSYVASTATGIATATTTGIARGIATATTTTTLWRQPSKWDLILEGNDNDNDNNEEENNDNDVNDVEYTPSPPDMIYNERNAKRGQKTFLAIRGAGGPEVTNDIYVRDPSTDVFWYTGKIARVSDISLDDGVVRQWPMIERHAAHLRPLELYPHRGKLEIWSAPGDSEMEVAYNRPALQLLQHTKRVVGRDADFPTNVKASMVGFQGEVYQEAEDGFRTWRTPEGFPARPELNPGGESRPPTPEELMEIQSQMQTEEKDSNDN